MEHQGPADELLTNWSLAPEDMTLLDDLAGPGRLGLAVQLAFWRRYGHFPSDDADVQLGESRDTLGWLQG